MLFSRSVIAIFTLAICSAFTMQSLQATPAEKDDSSADLFQSYSTAYFYQRSLQFQADLARSEYYLIWIYKGINEEVRKRQKESPESALEAIAPENLELIDDSLFTFPSDLEEAPLRIQYMAWEELQQKEFNHSFFKGRLIKDRLIETSNSQQKARMFRRDLEPALRSYRDGFYSDAIFQFTEAIDAYGYSNVGDLYFFRGECFFASRLSVQATEDFLKVLELDDLGYKLKALERLIIISGDAADKQKLDEYWNLYQSESGNSGDAEFMRVLELTARYYYAIQEWDVARELFDRIDETTLRFAHARLRAGDCYLTQVDIDAAEERYLQVVGIQKKKIRKKVARDIHEANLKLGYVNFIRGEFEKAIMQFSLVEGEDAVAEKAAVMTAWSWYRLHAYEQVVASCSKVLSTYPQTRFYYEITTLQAYCQEVLGESTDSDASYQDVMTAMDDRQTFQDFNYERQSIREAIEDIKRIEPLLFIQGQGEYLDKYMDLQRRFVTLRESIELTEAMTAHPVVGEIVNERREVAILLREHTSFQDSITSVEDVRLSREYDDLYADLENILREINSGVRYWKQQESLVQREEHRKFKTLAADSLDARLMQEWTRLNRSLKNLSSIKSKRDEVVDPDIMFAMAGIEASLLDMKNRIIDLRADLGDLDVSPIGSHLDHWSWFALNRHSTESSKFEDYYARKERLDEIDGYISQLNALLNEKLSVSDDTTGLAVILVPASEPGGEPYFAPPAPMWQSPIPPVEEMPETAADTVAISDTTVTGVGEEFEVPTEGMSPEDESGEVESDEGEASEMETTGDELESDEAVEIDEAVEEDQPTEQPVVEEPDESIKTEEQDQPEEEIESGETADESSGEILVEDAGNGEPADEQMEPEGIDDEEIQPIDENDQEAPAEEPALDPSESQPDDEIPAEDISEEPEPDQSEVPQEEPEEPEPTPTNDDGQ